MTERTVILPGNGSTNGHDVSYRLTAMVPKRRYLSYLRERWWVVMVFVAASVGAIVAFETVRPETFSSFAQIHVAGDLQVNTGTIFTEDWQNYFGTQVELLKSPRLQATAFDRAGIVLKLDQKNPYRLEVVQPMKTSILRLQATGPDPLLTQRYLQQLVAAYLDYKKETRRNSSDELVSSLGTELQKREADLKAEQDKWAEFQKSNNVAVLEEESKSAGLYLADLNIQLARHTLERELIETGLDPILDRTNAPAEAAQVPGVPSRLSDTNLVAASSGDAMLKSARVELAVLRAEKARSELAEFHPAMRKLNDDIARLERTVASLEQQNLAQKKLDSLELEKRIRAVRSAIPPMEDKVLKLNEKLSESQRLKNNIQRLQNYYENLLSTLRSVDLGKNTQHENISLLQPPTPGQIQQRYLFWRIVLAALAGLSLSVGLMFCWYLLDDRFVSVRDIKDQFGESVLGLVPQVKLPRAEPGAALLDHNDKRTAYAECYRHLRSALLLSSAAGAGPPQTLLLTSTAAAEGKTTVAVNLARVLARSGLRVALVDADVHGSGVFRLMGGQSSPGILDFLRGDAAVPEITQPTDLPHLSFVPAGSHSNGAEGLFLRPQLSELVSELRKDRDFVILDGAPILAADDAALLVPHADAVVLVVRPFYTRSRQVRQALDMLYQRQVKRVVMVLNRARKDDLPASYYARNGAGKGKQNGAGKVHV